MKTVLRPLFFLFSCQLSAEITFDAEMQVAPESPTGTIYSHNGETYIDIRNGRFTVNDFDTKDDYVRINKGSLAFEGHAWVNKDRFVHAYSYRSEGSSEQQTEIDLYDNHGNVISSVTLPGRFVENQSAGEFETFQIGISPNGDYVGFAIFNRVYVYSSDDFALIHWESFEQYGDFDFEHLDVSADASKVALYVDGHAFTYDFESAEIFFVTECEMQPLYKLGFTNPESNELYFIGHTDRKHLCLSANGDSKYIRLGSSAMEGSFYDMDDEILIIVLQEGVFVFDPRSGEALGEFLVEPFFWSEYPFDDPYMRPFLVSNPTYMQDSNLLIAAGSVTIKSVFRIVLENK